jgi:hypothetical protein
MIRKPSSTFARMSSIAASSHRASRLRRSCPPGTRIARVSLSPSRQIASSAYLRADSEQAQKKESLMDKDKMNTGSTEYAKTGSDAQTAHSDQAFDPDTTRPETEKSKEGQEVDQKTGGVS